MRPTFAEGPSDELKDGLGKFHEPKLASFGAAAHGGTEKAASAVSAQKGWLLPCLPLELGGCLGEPRDGSTPEALGKSTADSAVSPTSASREPAGHGVCSLPLSFPPPLPAVHSSPTRRKTSGWQGWDGTARAQSALREPRRRVS